MLRARNLRGAIRRELAVIHVLVSSGRIVADAGGLTVAGEIGDADDSIAAEEGSIEVITMAGTHHSGGLS
jgi:hypothetical protein